MITYWLSQSEVRQRVLIPKFYNPQIVRDLECLKKSHSIFRIGDLIDSGDLEVRTGDEIGKSAYGTGDIPFVRTSDITNWEIKSAPKQGVSEEIYQEYAKKQDVRPGDILLVRDGTYLIGTNCFVSSLDQKMLYQSHILKFRVLAKKAMDPQLLFLSLNSDIVQRQIRSFQFTADTIDTIGQRFKDILIPLPKNKKKCERLSQEVNTSLDTRVLGKAFVRQAPFLIEEALRLGNAKSLKKFLNSKIEDVEGDLRQDTVSAEFGHFETFWHHSSNLKRRILLPKYYDPEINDELKNLTVNCGCVSIGSLVENGTLEIATGDEIGKMAYGTGTIAFLRTSDFANWEIKHDPKQGISEEIYAKYKTSQDIRAEDILLVRDGTYLVGSSCMITEEDVKSLYCGGLIKIRSNDHKKLDPYLLLGLMNSYIVKRQIRTKQFTRDVIDTLGLRLSEVILPIPKSAELRREIAAGIKSIVTSRIDARRKIAELTAELNPNA